METERDELEERLQALRAALQESQLGIDSRLEPPEGALALPGGVPDCGAVATGLCAHAEGQGTLASGDGSHAEGGATTAAGFNSHSEGGGTAANGDFAHAGGAITDASGEASHAEGLSSRAVGSFSHAEGGATSGIGPSSHAEGANTRAEGGTAHAEGSGTVARGIASHAEGSKGLAQGNASHAEGSSAVAQGYAAHAEGSSAVAQGYAAHAEGLGTTAQKIGGHAEGISTEAIGQAAHSEGFITRATGGISHVEGVQSEASGLVSHAEGSRTLASGDFSHAEGDGTSTRGFPGAHIMGKSGSARWAWSWFLANGLTSSGVDGIAAAIFTDGKAVADVGWFAGVADYAEMFETTDGEALECGYFVTLEGEKVRKARSGEFIAGATSANPAFVGDSGELRWKDKYQRDEWGTIHRQEAVIPAREDPDGNVLVEERVDIEPVLNPEFDETREYIPRLNRPEWVPVALMGKVLMRDDGTCEVDGYCASNDEGIATSSSQGFRVMRRTGSSQILILMR